jgi:hypothetical protein
MSETAKTPEAVPAVTSLEDAVLVGGKASLTSASYASRELIRWRWTANGRLPMVVNFHLYPGNHRRVLLALYRRYAL